MGSNIATLLSFVFVALFFILGVDLLSVQVIFTDLDRIGVTFSYVITKEGTVNAKIIDDYCELYNVSFTCLDNCTPKFGDVVEFLLSKPYQPILISKEVINVSITRTAVIGFYN